MSTPILREYQQTAIDRVRQAIGGGAKRVLLVAPVAAGKTVMFARVVQGAAAKAKRVCVIAHRTELIDQAHAKLADAGVTAGVIQGKRTRDRTLPVQVASIATLRNRNVEPFDVIIIDEAHRTASKSYVDELKRHPGAVVLGVTATPARLDGKSLHAHYDTLIEAATPRQLVEAKHLAPLTGITFDVPDTGDLAMDGSDFDAEQSRTKMVTLATGMVQRFLEHRQPAIFFGCNREHAQEMCQLFQGSGARFEYLDGETSRKRRKLLIRALADGELEGLSNVNVLTEGTDIPRVGLVILGFITASVTRYVQAIGRARRLFPGKERARVHDHGGNCIRLGHPDNFEGWKLDTRRKKKKAPTVHQCPGCAMVWLQDEKKCPNCGHEKPSKTGEKEIKEAELQAIDLDSAQALHMERRQEYQRLLQQAKDQGLRLHGWQVRG